MKKQSYLLFFILGFMAFNLQAQVRLNNVSAGVSYWNRTYSGPDERFFLISYDQDESYTKGAVMPHISAELNLIGDLAFEARVGLWSAEFNGNGRFGDLVVDEKIEQTIIPLSAGLLYRFNDVVIEDFGLYVGGGFNRYFIQNEVTRTITGGAGVGADGNYSGNSYGVYGNIGLEYYFIPTLGVALEGRYNSGFYNQSFRLNTDSNPIREQVDVQGFQVGLILRYRFTAGGGSNASASQPAGGYDL